MEGERKFESLFGEGIASPVLSQNLVEIDLP
jgi:hypothetical protein